MYLSHFKLVKKPFDIGPNPEFLWLGEKHREGLATLKYGILENKGFLMFTGDVGTGKTALIRAIEKEIQAKIIVVSIPDPGMDLLDFYNFMASELKMDRSFRSKGEFLVHFKRLTLDMASSYQRVLMIIDEAQRLTNDLLEEIRLLSNIDLGGKVFINTFFVGQSEFKAILAKNENRAVRQRIAVSYELSPLTAEEVRQYIEHRLKVAGATQEIFDPKAIRLIHGFSKGYPRLINIICDHALLSGYSLGVDSIGEDILKECFDELKITIGLNLHEETTMKRTEPQKNSHKTSLVPGKAEERNFSWRRAAVFAGIFTPLGVGWYLVGDRIPIELAYRGRGKELAPIQGLQAPKQGSLPQEASNVPTTGAPPLARTENASTVPLSLPPAIAPQAAVASHHSASTPPIAPVRTLSPTEDLRLKEFVVYFSQNSTEIPIYAQDIILAAASLLKSFPKTQARIEGHTDSIGDLAYNKFISERRAVSVKNYLESQEIEPHRLSVLGFGPENPLESNSTSDGRSKNRRVVIRIVTSNPR